jgi:hypothetical protein
MLGRQGGSRPTYLTALAKDGHQHCQAQISMHTWMKENQPNEKDCFFKFVIARKPDTKHLIQLSCPVGIGSDAVKYMWIMKA